MFLLENACREAYSTLVYKEILEMNIYVGLAKQPQLHISTLREYLTSAVLCGRGRLLVYKQSVLHH